MPYAEKVQNFLQKAKVHNATNSLRVEIDNSSNTLNKKVRNAQQSAVPYILVIGEREATDNTVSVRLRNNATITLSVDDFKARLAYEVNNRTDFSYTEEAVLDDVNEAGFADS